MQTSRDIQKGFIDAKRLYQIGILPINGVDSPGKFPVYAVLGRNQNKLRAFSFCLPDGFRRLHAAALGQLVFGENNPMPVFRISRHCHGHAGKLGPQHAFAGGIKPIAITMQDDALAHHETSIIERITLPKMRTSSPSK